MKTKNMSASNLRVILIVVILLMIGLAGVGFYFGQSWLKSLSQSVNQTVAESRTSESQLQSAKTLQADLDARQGVIEKANSLSESAQNYQTQAIKDLDTYATKSGISISNYNFSQAAAATATAVATPGAAAAATTSGMNTVTVTLVGPVSYLKLLRFMAFIETNLPKMQVSSVNLGRATTGGGDFVSTDQLIIEVYTK